MKWASLYVISGQRYPSLGGLVISVSFEDYGYSVSSAIGRIKRRSLLVIFKIKETNSKATIFKRVNVFPQWAFDNCVIRFRFKQIPKKWKVLSTADNGFPKSKWL